jgi:hypothetical protein
MMVVVAVAVAVVVKETKQAYIIDIAIVNNQNNKKYK